MLGFAIGAVIGQIISEVVLSRIAPEHYNPTFGRILVVVATVVGLVYG